MAATKTYHVVADPKGGWSVVRGGSEKASRHFVDKSDAIEWGKQVSRNQGSEFIVHRKDGTIEQKGLHGHDLQPARDSKR